MSRRISTFCGLVITDFVWHLRTPDAASNRAAGSKHWRAFLEGPVRITGRTCSACESPNATSKSFPKTYFSDAVRSSKAHPSMVLTEVLAEICMSASARRGQTSAQRFAANT